LDAFAKDANYGKPDGTPYDNNEEKRVIEQIETPYINASNNNPPDFDMMSTSVEQGTRTDHNKGTPYKSTGVNSITPADGRKQKGQSEESEFSKKMSPPRDNTSVKTIKPRA
jgi:hypothetical protein